MEKWHSGRRGRRGRGQQRSLLRSPIELAMRRQRLPISLTIDTKLGPRISQRNDTKLRLPTSLTIERKLRPSGRQAKALDGVNERRSLVSLTGTRPRLGDEAPLRLMRPLMHPSRLLRPLRDQMLLDKNVMPLDVKRRIIIDKTGMLVDKIGVVIDKTGTLLDNIGIVIHKIVILLNETEIIIDKAVISLDKTAIPIEKTMKVLHESQLQIAKVVTQMQVKQNPTWSDRSISRTIHVKQNAPSSDRSRFQSVRDRRESPAGMMLRRR